MRYHHAKGHFDPLTQALFGTFVYIYDYRQGIMIITKLPNLKVRRKVRTGGKEDNMKEEKEKNKIK